MSHPNNNQFNYPQGFGYSIPMSIAMVDPNYAFAVMNTSPCDEFGNIYVQHYQHVQAPIQQFQPPIFYDYPTPATFSMLDSNAVAQQEIFARVDNDIDLIGELFALDQQPTQSPQLVASYESSSNILEPMKSELTEEQHGVVLPPNMLEQIMTANADNNASVLEMLRSKIKAAMQGSVSPTVDTRPEIISPTPTPKLRTEHFHDEKQHKKKNGVVKKRRYVKSGLFRKDKNGNFIFSSSDRAKKSQLNQNEEDNQESSTQGSRVKRPLNAYNIFCKMHFDEVKNENPEMSINELSKLMGEKWKAMSANQKKVYYDKVELGQTRYKKPLNSYNLFCKKNFDALKKEFPNKSIHVLSKIIAERWKKLSESEKKIYYDEADRQKQEQQPQENFANEENNDEQSTCEQQHDQLLSYDGPNYDIFNNSI
jgi:hypothetical protein